MDSVSEIKESLTEWQEIKSVQGHTNAIAETKIQDDHISQDNPPSPSSSSSSLPPPEADAAGGSVRRRLSCGMVQMLEKLRKYLSCRTVFWSFAPVAAAAIAVGFLCVRAERRWRRRRVRDEMLSRLVALVQEKDQRIRQLHVQLIRMKELLSERRRVPVIRN